MTHWPHCLNVILGQLPLDLHLLSHALKTHIRVGPKVKKGWAGKGAGKTGQLRHILRMEKLLPDLKILLRNLDNIPKTKIWTQNYHINNDLSGSNIDDRL